MAVSNMTSSQLRLVFYTGADEMTGKPIYKGKNFNQVKTEVTPDQLYAVAHALADLQTFELFNIERRDQSEIKQG